MPGDRKITNRVLRALVAATSETEREAILSGPAPYDVLLARAIARDEAGRKGR